VVHRSHCLDGGWRAQHIEQRVHVLLCLVIHHQGCFVILLHCLFDFWRMNWLGEAPHQIPSAWLACVLVGADARDLCAETPLHRVPDRVFSPAACEREVLRVCGPWPSSLSLAPVCCACGDKTRRESWGSCGDLGQPCAGRDWPAFGHADGPWRALGHHAFGYRDRVLARRHKACQSAIDAY
jgi:hypothetical protein